MSETESEHSTDRDDPTDFESDDSEQESKTKTDEEKRMLYADQIEELRQVPRKRASISLKDWQNLFFKFAYFWIRDVHAAAMTKYFDYHTMRQSLADFTYYVTFVIDCHYFLEQFIRQDGFAKALKRFGPNFHVLAEFVRAHKSMQQQSFFLQSHLFFLQHPELWNSIQVEGNQPFILKTLPHDPKLISVLNHVDDVYYPRLFGDFTFHFDISHLQARNVLKQNNAVYSHVVVMRMGKKIMNQKQSQDKNKIKMTILLQDGMHALFFGTKKTPVLVFRPGLKFRVQQENDLSILLYAYYSQKKNSLK